MPRQPKRGFGSMRTEKADAQSDQVLRYPQTESLYITEYLCGDGLGDARVRRVYRMMRIRILTNA